MNYIFDLYGTLIDIWTDEERESLWRGVAAFLGEGEDRAAEVKSEYLSLCAERDMGDGREIDLIKVFCDMLASRGKSTEQAQSLATEFRRLSTVRLRRFHGVLTMLRELKRVGGVYLVSNAQSCFTVPELHLTGLYNLFDGIIISSDVGVKKPMREIFELAFDRFGIGAESSIYVGNDLFDDVLGASGVGLRTVYIETPQSRKLPEEITVLPTFVVKDHREMKKILLSLA